MKMKDIYIEQTNQFCEANCKITAQDILAKAKQKQSEDGIIRASESTKITSFPKKKTKSVFTRITQVAAACIGIFLLSGTTILAATGNLEAIISKIFTDNTTSGIIEEGHIYAIDQYSECGDFTLNLIAISGDKEAPQVIMDVYLNDEALAAANDRIFLTA